VTVLLFFGLIGFVFWLTSLHERPDFGERTASHPPLLAAEAGEAAERV
jgi:hypothetical protein